MEPGEQGVIGGYRLLRSLGTGGMGEVWLAEHPRLPRRVALKILRTGSVDVPDAQQRFLREAETVARLDHPSVIDVVDRGQDGGRLWIAMRFVEGEDLLARLRRAGPMSVADALRIARAVADAIDHAHANGVIHRDIKPANILLPTSGQPAAVVTDFGIARAVEEVNSSTGQGTVVGSMSYLSPEQFDGARADERSDVYAFACTIYEMLCGAKAFDARTTAALIAAHFTQPRPSLRVLNPELSEAVDRVIRRGLAVDPTHRWSSAGAMVAALERVATMAPEASTLVTKVDRTKGRATGTSAAGIATGRNKAVWVGTFALVAVAAAATVAVLVWPNSSPTPNTVGSTIMTSTDGGASSSTRPTSSPPSSTASSPSSPPSTPANPPVIIKSQTETSSSTSTSSSSTASRTSSPTSSSSSESVGPGGDLGLAQSISAPGCGGAGVVVLHSSASNSVDQQRSDVTAALAQFPGASYMRPSCGSIRSIKDGQQIYTVYAPTTVADPDEAGLCAAVKPYATASAGSPYGKFLDGSHPVGHFYRWDAQIEHCYYYADTSATRRLIV
ncbi:serine/threonine-protein kinase [Calidifontibacter terrae]